MNQGFANVRFGQLSQFQAENTEVLGISANAPFSQKAFADFAKINYPLLSDRDGKVMQAFGVYDEPRRIAKRAYVVVDKEGSDPISGYSPEQF